MIPPTMYNFQTVPAFYNALRQVRSSDVRSFQDDEARMVGFIAKNTTFAIKVSAIRSYYHAVCEGDHAPQKEAQMFARDINSILQTKETR